MLSEHTLLLDCERRYVFCCLTQPPAPGGIAQLRLMVIHRDLIFIKFACFGEGWAGRRAGDSKQGWGEEGIRTGREKACETVIKLGRQFVHCFLDSGLCFGFSRRFMKICIFYVHKVCLCVSAWV